MEGGHRLFLAGVALLLLGSLVTIPAIFSLNLGLAYVGIALSFIGFILFVVGIHVFMGQTIVEVRDILSLPGPNQEAEPTRMVQETAHAGTSGLWEALADLRNSTTRPTKQSESRLAASGERKVAAATSVANRPRGRRVIDVSWGTLFAVLLFVLGLLLLAVFLFLGFTL